MFGDNEFESQYYYNMYKALTKLLAATTPDDDSPRKRSQVVRDNPVLLAPDTDIFITYTIERNRREQDMVFKLQINQHFLKRAREAVGIEQAVQEEEQLTEATEKFLTAVLWQTCQALERYQRLLLTAHGIVYVKWLVFRLADVQNRNQKEVSKLQVRLQEEAYAENRIDNACRRYTALVSEVPR